MKRLSLILFVAFTSFTKPNEGVSIIFHNKTDKDFRLFKANILGREVIFENLKSGEKTGTVTVPRSCRYCYAQAVVNTDTLLCQLDDYVGETVYTNGKIIMTISTYSQKGLEKNIAVSGTWDAYRFISPKNYR